MIIAKERAKMIVFLNFRFLSSGQDEIVPFFSDYEENHSKEPIGYDQWYNGG